MSINESVACAGRTESVDSKVKPLMSVTVPRPYAVWNLFNRPALPGMHLCPFDIQDQQLSVRQAS
jgi:hypothetical protein